MFSLPYFLFMITYFPLFFNELYFFFVYFSAVILSKIGTKRKDGRIKAVLLLNSRSRNDIFLFRDF